MLTSAPRSGGLSTTSVAEATPSRSPGVSSTAFRAQPPNLRFASLMDMDFAVSCPLVRRWRLISGFCPSTRTFAPCFLQTPPRGGSPCIITRPYLHQVGQRTFTSKLLSMPSTQRSRWRGGRFACTSLIRRWSLEGLAVARYDGVNMDSDVSSISMSINNGLLTQLLSIQQLPTQSRFKSHSSPRPPQTPAASF
jgi:hypothetical protein